MVSWEIANVPVNVTGETTERPKPVGDDEAPRLTAPINPLVAVTLMFTLLDEPTRSAINDWLELIVKSTICRVTVIECVIDPLFAVTVKV
jgi:hypothetical protein